MWWRSTNNATPTSTDLYAGQSPKGVTVVTPQSTPQLTSLPMWRQLANHLRERIQSGMFATGQPIPPERRLADEYGVSLTVVRQATKALEAEGLLVVRRPHGTIVRDPHARPPTQQRGLTLQEGRYLETGEQGWADTATPTFTRTDATVWHADLFAIKPGEPILTRDVLQQDQTGHRRSQRLLMPFRVAADLNTPWLDDPHLPEPTAVYAWLHGNSHPLTFTESVWARMPVGDETTALRLTGATPLLIVSRTAHTNGRTVTLEEVGRPADQTEPAYPLPVTTNRPAAQRTTRKTR